MRKNKKGFTLVELVIVIAVIAILAGVMIAVFSNVVNDAKESAELQEMKQAELQQKMEDITAKLENADWLSWEDIEVAIAEGLDGVEAGASTEEITAAIDNAIKEYADSLGSGNTGVTEEQIKYIIENSLSGQLTSAQVEAIVKRYQSDPTVSLSASQIAQIKEAASANSLTVAQIQQVVEAVGNDTYADVKAAIDAIVPNGGISSLTSDEVSSIVNTAMAQYVRNGVAGDYKWYTNEVEQKITSGQAVTLKLGGTAAGDEVAIDKDGFKAIAGLSAEGVSFKNVTIELEGDLTLDGVWTPIGTEVPFEGTIIGTGDTPSNISVAIDNSFNSAKKGYAIEVDPVKGNADKYGVGFVASLGEGAVLENLNITVNFDIADTGADGVLVGGAVGYLYGGTVRNVTVNGTIKNYYRAGGIVGGGFGTVENCINNATVASTGTSDAKTGYYRVGGIIGYARVLGTSEVNTETLTITNCQSKGALLSTNPTGCGAYIGDWNAGASASGSVILDIAGNTDTHDLPDISTKSAAVIAEKDATYVGYNTVTGGVEE